MKIGSAILGIVGGTIALIFGVLSFFIGGLGESLGIDGAVALQIASLALPIAALVGGGIASRNNVLGGILMIASAAGILLALEIGILSLIMAIPIGLGGILALVSSASSTNV